MAIRVRAGGTLSDGDGAAGGQHGHAERSEASQRLSSETLRCAQGDKTGPSKRARPFAALRVTRRGHRSERDPSLRSG